ncbi:MAG TPA: UvrD-helicase domain-containing protein [Gemmatimonadaceae bacterium]
MGESASLLQSGTAPDAALVLTPHTASASQRSAIEAALGPVLVLAGPGAGKTFCLIERIRYLIEKKGVAPDRICAFTFTNKAAGEISSRLEKFLGPKAGDIKRGTLHAFCAELLREFAEHSGLQPGFGIADEEYSTSVLRRIGVQARWHARTLRSFTSHRFIDGYQMDERDASRYMEYIAFLNKRNLVDFDMLVMKTADLLRLDDISAKVRSRWDVVLVDEFQDLTPVQYQVIHALAKEHRNIFVVGDDEQSIYSWAGASPKVFTKFINDFGLDKPTSELAENRRCPREIVDLARKLANFNTPIFAHRSHAESDKPCAFPVAARKFATADDEVAWVIEDLCRDRAEHGLRWGDYALLYRANDMGNGAEARFLTAGVPCRMANGRALSDDPVVRYVIAALRVIGDPSDPIHHEGFLQVVLPRPLFDSVRMKAEERHRDILAHLERTTRHLPREHEDGRKLRRAIAALRNLTALGQRHDALAPLVNELLSHKVGQYLTVLEENHDELSDPAENPEIEALARRIEDALDHRRTVWIPRMGGVEIALKGMLATFGITRVQLGGYPPDGSIGLGHADCASLGIALGLFKAMQLLRSREFVNHFRDFTAIDIETTDNNVTRAELVEIAAVRVRNGRVADELRSFVKPDEPISGDAFEAHGISEHDVSDAPSFAEIWPRFREFCGSDVVVAHNGHNFDFPILRRMAGEAEFADIYTYDTLVLARELRTGSASLQNLARVYEIPPGRAHHALDDTRTLAKVFLALGEEKLVRARKTCLDVMLDYLGIGLSLSDRDTLCEEAERLRELTRFYALGRYTRCLDFYRAECDLCTDVSVPALEELIEMLGGEGLRERMRTDKTADERYPEAMLRLRPLLAMHHGLPLKDQIAGLLERITLSKWDGVQVDDERVNLLTLHSTKGLEFSRVYILGTDDLGFTRDDRRSKDQVEELRRLLYVGMTRTMDRLVLTCAQSRNGEDCGGHRMLDEMEITPEVM